MQVSEYACEHASTSTVSAVLLNDLYHFNPATVTWTALFPSGSAPSPRCCNTLGFTSTPDGIIYVYGGIKDENAYFPPPWSAIIH
jgi:hypothetical protein